MSQMVSIIVPVYKVENCIQKCIDSVLQQTYTDWELILVDDGSPDNSGNICDENAKKDTRIKVFHKKNGGVSSARNYGLDNAVGEWIVFIDSDDYVERTYLENFFYHQKYLSSRTIVIQGVIYDMKYSKTFRKFPDAVYRQNEICSCILEHDLFTFGAPYCKLYNASLLKNSNIRFPINYSYGEDTVFFLKYMALVETVILVSPCNYHYIEWNFESLSHKSHPFKELKLYVEDNILAVRTLDKRFESCNLLMKSHSDNIEGFIKKMLLDIHKLENDRIERIKYYKEIKTIIRVYSCYRYSKLALLLIFVPINICEYIINKIVK